MTLPDPHAEQRPGWRPPDAEPGPRWPSPFAPSPTAPSLSAPSLSAPSATAAQPYAAPYQRSEAAGHPQQWGPTPSTTYGPPSAHAPQSPYGPPPAHTPPAPGWPSGPGWQIGHAEQGTAGGQGAPGGQDRPRRPSARRVVLTAASLALAIAAVVLASTELGVVAVIVGLVGVVAGLLGLWPTRSRDPRGRGWAVGGVAASCVAAGVGAAMALVTGTGVGAVFGTDPDEGTLDVPTVGLRTGESGTVGEYAVTVDEIRMDADATLAADPENPDNPPAEGRYVEAVVTVTFQGTGLGSIVDDLLVSYAGSTDGWLYDEWSCAAETEAPPYTLHRLTPGESATFVSCMDVPADVVDEAAVVVEDLSADEPTGEAWGERPAS
jgi:hypothetical protein